MPLGRERSLAAASTHCLKLANEVRDRAPLRFVGGQSIDNAARVIHVPDSIQGATMRACEDRAVAVVASHNSEPLHPNILGLLLDLLEPYFEGAVLPDKGPDDLLIEGHEAARA